MVGFDFVDAEGERERDCERKEKEEEEKKKRREKNPERDPPPENSLLEDPSHRATGPPAAAPASLRVLRLVLLQALLAEPVVDPARLLVPQRLVGGVDLGEPPGCRGLLLLAARDLVGVVLQGQFAVGALDLAVVGPPGDAEDVVEVFAVVEAEGRGRV